MNLDATKNPLFSIDFYKVGHKDMAPEGTQFVYANFTPRFDKYAPVHPKYYDHKLVVFGIQAYLIRLEERWNEGFFNRDCDEVVAEYKKVIDDALFTDMNVDHITALWNLGYLPVEFRALEEGSLCPMGVPVLTIHNTHPDFHWLPTYLETDISTGLWQTMTNATVARNYRMVMEYWHKKTGLDGSFIPWQGHDFSARGLPQNEAAAFSGMAHLTSFLGTDTVMAIPYVKHYYGADPDKCFVGHSVPATEHSVTCMNGQAGERDTIARWIKQYPSGILSNVCDTWDYFNTIDVILPSLKAEIMVRDGKYVVRPDSGDPVKIITGYVGDECTISPDAGMDLVFESETGRELSWPEFRGSVETLHEHFGAVRNEKGYYTLDSHVGLIYGDSITTTRANDILERLSIKGYAADNIVFGIGSYTYQMNTRDSFGFAMKATYCVVNGEGRDIQKNPKTDDGKKKSATGLMRVDSVGDTLVMTDKMPAPELNDLFLGKFNSGLLKPVWKNGDLLYITTLSKIRMKLWNWNDSK
jgi:nicotinamide phosphoribosyltransferase